MLPGDNDRELRPVTAYKLSIGEIKETKDGTPYPSKMDYFTIRRFSVQSGQHATYIVDEDLQAALCEAVGATDGKPRRVPVSPIGNPYLRELPGGGQAPDLPSSILWSRMAFYWGNRCQCFCSKFDENNKGVATRRRWEKQQRGEGKSQKEIWLLKDEQQIECDPATCPFATGNLAEDKFKNYWGTPLCKPQIMAHFELPFWPEVGAVATLKTTGWYTHGAIRSSLLNIALRTEGWLHEVPLQLRYGYNRSSRGQLVPQLSCNYPGSKQALRAEAKAVKQLYLNQTEELKRLEAHVVSLREEELENPLVEAAHQAEFAPEGVGQDPVIEADFEELEGTDPHRLEEADYSAEPTAEEQAAIRKQELAEYENGQLALEEAGK